MESNNPPVYDLKQALESEAKRTGRTVAEVWAAWCNDVKQLAREKAEVN